MSGQETMSARLITVNGKRFVVLPLKTWEALIKRLEDLADQQIVEEALKELQAAGGDPEKAGWPKWEDVEKALMKPADISPEEQQ